MSKERPILFSGSMIKVILEGRKTMTRRVIKPNISSGFDVGHGPEDAKAGYPFVEDEYGDFHKATDFCPYGKPGDRLWVRETWRVGAWSDEDGICVDYRADNYCRKDWLGVPDEGVFERLWVDSTDDAIKAGLEPDENGRYWWQPGQAPTRWRPSIFMPRWASRITLKITEVRAERLQDISEADAIAEGVTLPERTVTHYDGIRKHHFRTLWDALNAKRGYGWDANPWVFALRFERV